MQALILAGGEGSRLATDGIDEPKPLVRLAGKPQIVRLIEMLSRLGASGITCMVRDNVTGLNAILDSAGLSGKARVIYCRTPSSLHTLVEGLAALPPGPVFCTMVDTVMRDADWELVWTAAVQHIFEHADLVLAVTSFIDDERPLYVQFDADGFIRGISDDPVEPPCVTGGVYGLSDAARSLAHETLAAGHHRMRVFLRKAVESGLRTMSVSVPRIIDLDRRRDLALADEWLGRRPMPEKN